MVSMITPWLFLRSRLVSAGGMQTWQGHSDLSHIDKLDFPVRQSHLTLNTGASQGAKVTINVGNNLD